MKKLKVFNDFEKDIFFAPAQKNNLGRFDSLDRAKCYIWERERTSCKVFPELLRVIEARQELQKYIDIVEKKYEDRNIWEGDNLKDYYRDMSLLDVHENTRQLFVESARHGEKFLGENFQNFPYLVPDFPHKAYLNLDLDDREDLECPLDEFEYKNITRKHPTQLFRNPGVYDIFNNKGLIGKLNHLIHRMFKQRNLLTFVLQLRYLHLTNSICKYKQ